jgi:hypothetical protein
MMGMEKDRPYLILRYYPSVFFKGIDEIHKKKIYKSRTWEENRA